MADFPTVNNPEKTDDFDFSELFDGDQWLNMVVGINRSKDGVEQATAEMMEMLGLEKPGYAENVTQAKKDEQAMIRESTSHAAPLSGAAGYEFAGEAAPLFLAPLGGSVKAAAALGGATSSTFFQDNVNESRLDDIGIGIAGGALMKKLLQGGAALNKAKQATSDFAAPSGGFVGPRDMVGPRSPGPRGPAARYSAKDFYPARADGIQGRQINPRQQMVPSQGSRALVPVPKKRGITAEDFLAKGEDQHISNMRRVLREGGKGANYLKQAAIEKTAVFAKKAAEKAKRIAGAVARTKGAEKAALLKLAAQAESEEAAVSVLLKSLQNGVAKGADFLPSGAVAKAMANKALPAPAPKPVPNPVIPKGKLETPLPDLDEVEQVAGKMSDLTDAERAIMLGEDVRPATSGGPGGRQGGFTNTDAQANLSGAMLGGAALGGLGAANSDGSPGVTLAAGALGAIGGARLGAKMATHAAKMADHSKRGVMRRVEMEAGKQSENITRNLKLKQYGQDSIADALTGGRKTMDAFLGSTMTRLEAVAPRLAVALRETEYATHVRKQEFTSKADLAFDKIPSLHLTDAQNSAFEIALMNSTESAKRVLRSFGKDTSIVDELASVSEDMATYLKTAGLGNGLRKNYFPRQVVDTSYFENIPEYKTYLERIAKNRGVDELTGYEKEIALSQVINGSMVKGESNTAYARAAANLQKRAVKVTAKNRGAYAGIQEGFHDMVDGVVTQVERRRFFQGRGVDVSDLGPNAENMDDVAGRLAKALSNGDMTAEQVDEATRLIRMRFGPGEQAPNRAIQNFKNLTYMGLLGNPMSAATQFGDVALSAYRNGIANTASSVVENIMGRGKIDGLDKNTLLGLQNAGAEFASKVGTRDALNWALKTSGFSKVDELGKNTFIRATMKRMQQMDPQTFKAKWAPLMDPDSVKGATPRTDKLMKDVAEFKGITPENREDVGFMLWNELSDMQPIALSSLPEKYLQHPNGRMAYMLQSFTLKLFDTMRKDIIMQAKAGNGIQATKNAVKLSTLFTMGNSGVDSFKHYMLGKEVDAPEILINNFLKMGGMSKYMVDGISKDGLGDTLLKQLAPPMALPNAIGSSKDALGMVPLAGRFLAGQEFSQ